MLRFLRESELHPFANPRAPGLPQIDGSDFNKTFDVNFDMGTGRFSMNNISWVPPSAPILLQILTGRNASELMPQGSIVPLGRNQVVQLNITSVSGVATPVSLCFLRL
jgi:iron transport multicopper oxidase